MLKLHHFILAGAALTFTMQSQATLIYDTDVTPNVIFGSGNANGG